MRIDETQTLTHPARLVFETLRDKTPELASIMPNVESVAVLERREEPPIVHLYNKWQATNDDVPGIIRPFVKKDLLSWYDRAAWDESGLLCRWQLESVVGRDCFTCSGTTRITEVGEGSSVFTINAELRVDPDHVPGVPRFLGRKIQEPLERFIGATIRPNLTKIASAVQRFLDGQRGQ
jgi:hypothetical protein